MNKKRIYSKRPRLKTFKYKGPYAYFLTVCTYQKQPYFKTKEVVNPLIEILRICATKCDFDVYAYCFMPNHLHLLVLGKSSDADLRKFISLFKQNSGYKYSQKHSTKLWQLSYYDHILRKDEDMLETAKYIFNNPVRKGIVDNYKEYPYLGSFVFDLDKL